MTKRSVFLVFLSVLGAVLVIVCSVKLTLYMTYSNYHDVISDSKSPEVSTIKFLQFNVFWRPDLIHIGRKEYVSERSKLLAEMINDYDVICLEEAFQYGSHVVQDFVKLMKAKGFLYAVSAKKVRLLSRFVVDSGMLIMSKYPIEEIDTVEYTAGCSFDKLSAKGALYAKIKTGERSHIHVFTTHLQATYSEISAKDFNVRMNQLRDLHEFMTRKVKDNAPIAVIGDFNINARKESFEIDPKPKSYLEHEYTILVSMLEMESYTLVDTLLQNSTHPVTFGDLENGKPVDEVLTYKTDRGVRSCLDYIFLMFPNNQIKKYHSQVEKFKVQNHIYTQLSDHYGISCTLYLNDPLMTEDPIHIDPSIC